MARGTRKPDPDKEARMAEFARQDEERGRAIARRAVEIGADKGGVDMLTDSLVVTTIHRKYGMLHELITMASKGIDAP